MEHEDSPAPKHFFGSSEDNDHARMFYIAFQARNIAQVARCAAIFSFAEHLDAGHSAAEIAAAEGLDPDATTRLLRACAAFGLARLDDDGGFAATSLMRTLRKDDPLNLRDVVAAQSGLAHWLPWGRLDDAIRTGKAQETAALGVTMWDYFSRPENAEEASAFSRMMTGTGAASDQAVADIVDTTRSRCLVDVGGATGSLTHALLNRNKDLSGIVLDLAHVEPQATAAAEAAGLVGRARFAGGDFREEVPAGDLYVLRWILHDWPDEVCRTILRNCRRAASPGARLVLVEAVIDAKQPDQLRVGFDLTMLVLYGGRERTSDEFRSLLAEADFAVTRQTDTDGPFSIIEAEAV